MALHEPLLDAGLVEGVPAGQRPARHGQQRRRLGMEAAGPSKLPRGQNVHTRATMEGGRRQQQEGAHLWHCTSHCLMQASWKACPQGSALPGTGGAGGGCRLASADPPPAPIRRSGARASGGACGGAGNVISLQHTAQLPFMRSTCSALASCGAQPQLASEVL